MKLDNNKIIEKSESTGNSDKALMDCFDMAAWARDFYENQKCPSCKSNIYCAIKEAIEESEVSLYPFDHVSFGCKKWESRS